MNSESIFVVLIFLLVFNFLWKLLLDFLNEKHSDKPLPESVKDVYEKSNYEKSRAYQKTNYRTEVVSEVITFVITLVFFFSNGFAWLENLIRSITANETNVSIFYIAVLLFASTLVSLPFGIHKTFVVEQKYGFNKNTKANFILDFFKGLFISAVLGGIILFVIIKLYQVLGGNFWWVAWLFISGFSVFMTMFYSSLIVPLFNTQHPLEEGSLKTKINELAMKLDFRLDNIFVINGSKRSTKANAYFSGIGAKKRIVLFDTLIDQLSEDEVVAVLAHEVGHYKKKHTLFGTLLGVLQMGLTLFIFSFFIGNPLLSESLGVSQPSFHIGLIVFSILWSPISTVIGLLSSIISRRFEYQADAYAREHFNAKDLVTSLKKLSANSFSNLNPHKLYVFFNYSHPTLSERIKELEKY